MGNKDLFCRTDVERCLRILKRENKRLKINYEKVNDRVKFLERDKNERELKDVDEHRIRLKNHFSYQWKYNNLLAEFWENKMKSCELRVENDELKHQIRNFRGNQTDLATAAV